MLFAPPLSKFLATRLHWSGYNFLHSDSEKKSCGVGIYIDSSISYQIQTDIPKALNDSESLWIEINLHKKLA